MSMRAPLSIKPDLPLASAPAQWGVGLALALLMAATRGQHFASIDALPSASWAVFFLAGALLRPKWVLPALFVEASVLDFGSLAAGTVSDWCLSPAYWALVPAYACLWLAGRIYAGAHRERWSTVPVLALVLIVAALVAYVCSGGGFYVFSGRYPEPTLTGFIARIGHYYPRALGTLAGYAGLGIGLHALVRALRARAGIDERARA